MTTTQLDLWKALAAAQSMTAVATVLADHQLDSAAQSGQLERLRELATAMVGRLEPKEGTG